VTPDDARAELDYLNSLTSAEQVLEVRCTKGACGVSAGQPCRPSIKQGASTCSQRWENLRRYRERLAFDGLGGSWHTGVPCRYCHASAGENCTALRPDDRTKAHHARIELSVRTAAKLANNHAAGVH
jgi:hypothetical protein